MKKMVVWTAAMAVAGALSAATPVAWDMETLGRAPQVWESGFAESNGVRSIFYEGVSYAGKPTRVFAYLAVPKVKPGEKVPGMVLVHGGLGSAFRRWAKFWCDQGYAAISMDTCGCVSGNEYGDEQSGHRRHEWAGPAGWGDFKNVGKPVADQWAYHAVAAVVRANSLLRSLPEVDPERIGLTGVSWGGYLTCMSASVDHRFNFAAPVYGCGYLDDNSVWKDNNGENGSTAFEFAKWCGLFDPRHYLGGAKCDFLWIDGSNDFAYPLDSLQKSVMSLKTAWYRATRLRMPHGHGPYAEHPKELVDFANFRLKKTERKTYPFVRACAEALGVVTVDWQADEDRIVKAELNWTADCGKWQTRKWTALPMTVFEGFASAEAPLPAEATCWYVNVFTEDGKCVSGELTERTDADIASLKAYRAEAAKRPSSAPLADGLAAAFDFTSSPGPVRRELHGASWVTRSYPRGFMNDDTALPAKFEVDYIRVYQREEPALVPAPKKMRMTGGAVPVSCAALETAVRNWQSDLSLTNEGYRISVSTNGVTVSARDAAGAFYAGRTLRQMVTFPSEGAAVGSVPCVEIDDAPQFSWRGLHLDVSRHFFGAEPIKRLLDRMADLKLNVFHWHLTDGAGWRLPSRRYPKLNGKAARTRPVKHAYDFRDLAKDGEYGPFAYTEEEVREIVAYAAERHIRVVPEIEMPGHATALLRAYPELACFPGGVGAPTNAVGGVVCAGNPAVTKMLEGILDEVCEMFPDEIIHIGGDEVPKVNWMSCPRCRARMEREGLKNGVELENRMMRQLSAYLAKRGRRAIMWEEAMDGGGFDASSRAIAMSWNGYDYAKRAAAAGFDTVVCPIWVCYFDYPQGRADDPASYPGWAKTQVTLEKVYRFNPAGPVPAAHRVHVLGGQGNNWTECTCTEAELMHKVFPRAAALAEALWTAPSAPRDFGDFKRRLLRCE